jgi:hypothetical protein
LVYVGLLAFLMLPNPAEIRSEKVPCDLDLAALAQDLRTSAAVPLYRLPPAV